MSEEWGPWIEHDGKGCPCAGHYVQAVGDYPSKPGFEKVVEGVARSSGEAWDWRNIGVRLGSGKRCGRIIRYRIRKPKGLTILESVLREVEREKVAS